MLKQVKAAAGLDEGYHVTAFKGYRPTRQGGAFEVTVEVWDSGSNRMDSRYVVRALDERGRIATGIPGPTVAEALTSVNWDEAASRDRNPHPPHGGAASDPA